MGLRPTLFTRLLLLLCGTSGLATLLALLAHERFLAHELARAADLRLNRSAHAVSALFDAKLARMRTRYADAVLAAGSSASPRELVGAVGESAGARVVVFERGGVAAAAGDPMLDALLHPGTGLALRARGDRLYFVVGIDLPPAGSERRLAAAEPVDDTELLRWSDLAGESLRLVPRGEPAAERSRTVLTLDDRELRIVASSPLAGADSLRSRLSLGLAELLAFALACAGGYFVARSVSRPILEIKDVAQRLGHGDLGARLRIRRPDEIGEVCTAVNEMALHLEEFARDLRQTNFDLMGLNSELSLAKERAEAASRAKTAFLANISHEIRTPMTAILGYTDLLLDPERPSEDRAEWMRTIRRNGDHLLALINDILDLSKIEAGKLEIEWRTCSPAEIVRDVLSLVSRSALDKGLDLRVEYSGPVPATIRTDPTRLRQILVNLVANATKFTAAGSVRVVVAHEPARELSPSRLRVDVIDTGIGIPRHKLQSIFEPFSQGDVSTTRKYGGSGLGLTISRKLARILGGDLIARSRPGRGSTFRLTVETGDLNGVEMVEGLPETKLLAQDTPAPAAAPTRDEPDAAQGTMRGRVLVAEDGPDNQRLIRAFLHHAGLEADLVANGAIAVERALGAAADGKPYDVILMDMQMPVMDGYEATQRLRAEGYQRPIVALTAHAMESDRERCLEAGCNDYATKPIHRARLLELLARLLEQKPPSA
jgi:signal transduction histidine kinase/ActR/RegA family two-component response regulator